MKRPVAAFPLPENFQAALLLLSRDHSPVMILNSNRQHQQVPDRYASYDFLAAIGKVDEIQGGENCFPTLQDFLDKTGDWIFGGFSYDLKNQLEKLYSDHPDRLGFPDYHFFQPRYVLAVPEGSDQVFVHYLPGSDTISSVEKLMNRIQSLAVSSKYVMATDSYRDTTDRQHAPASDPGYPGENATVISKPVTSTTHARDSRVPVSCSLSKEEYIETVNRIQQHLAIGDIYEMNFCVEFFAEETEMDPVQTFRKLNAVSPMPFSCFYRVDDRYLLCASPERFLKKAGNKIISQPIKGTARRGNTAEEDQLSKERLRSSRKEQSENVMIVDLVRNDLSRTARPGTVAVEELFGIYSFQTLHQMISTVVSEVDEDKPVTEIIKKAFPMGSMTGAPKIKAMQLIEKYEKTRRGLYSGATGYFSPAGDGSAARPDFDLNVVIRSIGYHAGSRSISFMAGSAITVQSDAESEYEECLLKAQSMKTALSHD